MSRASSMSARREITKKDARECLTAGRAEKGRLLDARMESTGWHRDYARRAIRKASTRKGAAGQQQGKRGLGSIPATR